MSKKAILYTAFFVLLSVAFYLIAATFIPGYADKKLPPISKVGAFSFTNQDGQAFTNKDVAGKVYVTEYFFTTCKGICPVMNTNMQQVYKAYKDRPDFLIISHTCQPEVDSVPVLKRYADSLKVNTKQWIFLTGRKDSLYNMARLSYKIDDEANNLTSIEDDFLHTQFWALVNKKGEVIRIYDGLKQPEINALMSDIDKELKTETP